MNCSFRSRTLAPAAGNPAAQAQTEISMQGTHGCAWVNGSTIWPRIQRQPKDYKIVPGPSRAATTNP